jgi:hypothetical protein
LRRRHAQVEQDGIDLADETGILTGQKLLHGSEIAAQEEETGVSDRSRRLLGLLIAIERNEARVGWHLGQ